MLLVSGIHIFSDIVKKIAAIPTHNQSGAKSTGKIVNSGNLGLDTPFDVDMASLQIFRSEFAILAIITT